MALSRKTKTVFASVNGLFLAAWLGLALFVVMNSWGDPHASAPPEDQPTPTDWWIETGTLVVVAASITANTYLLLRRRPIGQAAAIAMVLLCLAAIVLLLWVAPSLGYAGVFVFVPMLPIGWSVAFVASRALADGRTELF